MRIAVVTTVYNMAAEISDALASVQEQTRAPDLHCVVDDASTNDCYRAVLAYKARAPYPVWYIGLAENRGHAGALNVGMAESRFSADWIVKLDADDRLERTALERIERAALGDCNVVYSDFQLFGDFDHRFIFPPFDAATMTERCQIPGPAAFRRSLWEAVGGFDETMRYGEDWDFYVRAEKAVGLKPVRLPDPLYFYRTYRNWAERHADQPHQDLFKDYWRGHHKDNIGTRTWASWLEEQAVAA